MDALTRLVVFVCNAAAPVTLVQCAAHFPRRKVGNIRKQLARAAMQGRIVSSAEYRITADALVVSCSPTYRSEYYRLGMVLGNAFLSIKPELSEQLHAVARELGPEKTCKLLAVLIACATNDTLTFAYTDKDGNKSWRDVREVGQVFKATEGFCVWGYGTKHGDTEDYEPASRCFRVDRMDAVRISGMVPARTGQAYPLVHKFGSKPVNKDVWAQHPTEYTEAGAILF